jgi:hypothetical protein
LGGKTPANAGLALLDLWLKNPPACALAANPGLGQLSPRGKFRVCFGSRADFDHKTIDWRE